MVSHMHHAGGQSAFAHECIAWCNVIYGLSQCVGGREGTAGVKKKRSNCVTRCWVMTHAFNTDAQSTTTTTTTKREVRLTVRFHPDCGELWAVWEGGVRDHAGHVVLILQKGGEAQAAAQGGGAVRVSGFRLVHGERVTWGGAAAHQPADLRPRPGADGRARHRLVVRAVYDLLMVQHLDLRPNCEVNVVHFVSMQHHSSQILSLSCTSVNTYWTSFYDYY